MSFEVDVNKNYQCFTIMKTAKIRLVPDVKSVSNVLSAAFRRN